MNFGCHRSERSQSFRNSNFVSHIPKSKLSNDEARKGIRMYEGYFNQLIERNFEQGLGQGARGNIRFKNSQKDIKIEVSGNSRNGSILLRSGLNQYSEIHFSPRAIHVYHHEGGSFGQEAAIYLNRRLPTESYGFGVTQEVARLLNCI